MEFNEILRSSQQSLRGNPLRTCLTMLGIIIGISAVILISSIGQGAIAFITDQLSIFGTNYFRIVPGQNAFAQVATTSDPLTTKDSDALQAAGISNIQLVAPLGVANATITGNDEKVRAIVRGTVPEVVSILELEVVYGQFISAVDNDNHARVVVLGTELSKKLFGDGTNPVGEGIRIDSARYRVIGLVKSSSSLFGNVFNNAAIVPLESLITNISGVDELFQIVVSVDNEDYLDQTISDAETFLRDYRDIDAGKDSDFHIESFKDSLETVKTVTGLLTLLITGISAISLVVGGVGVMNIMLVTVTERTREIGLLKAIGAREKDILIQFLIESVALSMTGGAIGIFVGVAGAWIVSRVAPIPFVVNPVAIVAAIGVSTVVGVVFGLYPARKASRLNPIEALRYE